MMRTIRTSIWFLPAFALMLSLSSGAWAQDPGGASPGQTPNEPQVVEPPDGSVNWKGVGIGAGTVLTNVVYVPAKLAYGILGAIAGGAGYAVTGGNTQVANSIWRSSLGGDYVLTPDMMTGKKPIYFSGPSQAGQTQAATTGNSSLPSNPTTATGSDPAATPGAGAYTAPTTTHPMDSGAGPIGSTAIPPSAPYAGAANNASSSYRASPRPSKTAPSGDTSVE
jgi:hypothetical protein